MITFRILETTLDIIDYISFFIDEDANIMEALKTKYTLRCYMNVFVIDIIEVIRKSACIVNNIANVASMNVQFKAKVIYYSPGELLVGCNIVQSTDDQSLLCTTQHAHIIASTHKLYSSFIVGQKIIIKVIESKYQLNDTKIKILGECYIAPFDDIKYIPCGEINQDIINDLLDEIKYIDQLTANSKHLSEWNAFNSLMSSYVRPQIDKAARLSTFDDFIKKYNSTPCVVWRDRTLDLSNKSIYISTVDLHSNAIKISVNNVLIALIYDYIAYLSMISEMVDIYTVDVLSTHRNLTKLLNKLKQGN